MLDPLFADERASGVQDDLRQQIADLLVEREEMITTDTVAIFPYSGVESLDADYCHRVGQRLARLLGMAVREGRVDPRGNLIADLHRVVIDRALSIERLFTFAYLTERTTVDELALDDGFAPRASHGRSSRSSSAAPRSTCWRRISSALSWSRAGRPSPTS